MSAQTLICPRCRSVGCQTLAESPVQGVWTVCGQSMDARCVSTLGARRSRRRIPTRRNIRCRFD